MNQTPSGLYVASVNDLPGVPEVPKLETGLSRPSKVDRIRGAITEREEQREIRSMPRAMRRAGMRQELAAMRRIRRAENRRATHVEKVIKGEISPMRKLPTVKP